MSLTATQTALLQSTTVQESWIFSFDTDNDGDYEYNYSTKQKVIGSITYSAKILDFTPLEICMAPNLVKNFPESECTIKISNSGSSLSPATFKGGTVRVALVLCADIGDNADNSNLISNGDMEADPTGDWQAYHAALAEESSIKHGGSLSLKVTNAGADARAYKGSLTLEADKKYYVSGWVYNDSGNTGTTLGKIEARSSTGDLLGSATSTGSDAWEQVSFSFHAAGTDAVIRLCPQSDTDDFSYFDDIIIHDSETEAECLVWRFKIKSGASVYQTLELKCQDWFSSTLEGSIGNDLVSDLFPLKSMADDNVCAPILYGQPFIPLRFVMYWRDDVTYVDSDTFTTPGDRTVLYCAGQYIWCNCGADGYKSCFVDSSSYAAGTTTVNLTAASDDITSNLTRVGTDGYLLGRGGATYTVERAKSPIETNFDKTYLPANYTFRQVAFTGSDSNGYSIVQLVCRDYDKDGTNDVNGIWFKGDSKGQYDAPFRFSRNDTVSLTSPEEIFEHAAENYYGIPSDEIDDTALSTANTTYYSRGFTMDVGIWYQMTRQGFMEKLLLQAGAVIIPMNKLEFRVLTKVSQSTIGTSLVKKGTFKFGPTKKAKNDYKDSGYILWQESTETVERLNKTLVACKSSTSYKSGEVIDCSWILGDGTKAQKAGKLALQKLLLPDGNVSFQSSIGILIYKPGDMLTVDEDNYNADGSSYDFMLTGLAISKDLKVDVAGVTFSDDLDDWSDLSTSAITIESVEEGRGCSQVQQGISDADGAAGTDTNTIVNQTIIGANGEIKTGLDPATDGGFLITNTYAAGYNTNGDQRFRVDYGGANQGDVEIGDYGNDKGCMWDQSEGTFTIRGGFITSSGSVKRFEISDDDDEAHFYGDRGDSTITEIATIGINSTGSDYVIGYFGGSASGNTRVGVLGESYSKSGVRGYSDQKEGGYFVSNNDIGVYGKSVNGGVGGYFEGYQGNAIQLKSTGSASAPSHSANFGTVAITTAGIMYINISSPTPGTTWQKIGSQ